MHHAFIGKGFQLMSIRNVIKGIRTADKRWGRRRSNSRRILVDARTAMNFAVVAPVFTALKNDPRISFYFTSSENPRGVGSIYGDLECKEQIISSSAAAMLRFDAYLTADLLWARLLRAPERIFMFHGVAGKYAKTYDAPEFSMRHWDRIFFINRRRLRNFISSGALDPDSKSARMVGYPKLDRLVDGTLTRDDILESLGVDPNEKTILYAPTWSPHSSLNLMGEELLRQLCAAGYKVIVKLHDRSWFQDYEFSGGIDWGPRLDAILSRHGGYLARVADLTPLLAAADIMITDHSSAGFEYLLLDRPLIRIEVPELIAATEIPADYVSLMAEAAFSTRTVAGTVEAVEQALSDPFRRSMSRRAVAEELFYDPGRATGRAVSEMYEILELDRVLDGFRLGPAR